MIIVVVGKESPAFAEVAPEVEFRFVANLSEADDVIETMDAVIGRVPPEILAKAKQLRWVHSPAAGVDADLSPEMLASDVVLTSSAGNGGISWPSTRCC